jgi:4-amino-4-deoxy-L-arabinose transferase-like glycosyltransferase
MLVPSRSNLASIGAEWAWKERRGPTERSSQVASEKVSLGAGMNWDPVAGLPSGNSSPPQTVKQVGYPYQFSLDLDGSPTRKGTRQ